MNGRGKDIQSAVVNVDMTGTPTVVALIHIFLIHVYYEIGPGSVVGIATGYGLDGPGIE